LGTESKRGQRLGTSEIWSGRLHQNHVGSTLPECGLHVPNEDLPAPRPRGEDLPVRGEGHRPDPVRMPGEGAEFPSRGHVPELDRPVLGPRGEGLPVRGEGHRLDPVRMPCKGADLRPCGHVPELDRLVPRPGGKGLPVRIKIL